MKNNLINKFALTTFCVIFLFLLMPRSVLANEKISVKVRVAPHAVIMETRYGSYKIMSNIEKPQINVQIIDLFSNKTVDNFVLAPDSDHFDLNKFKLNGGLYRLEIIAQNFDFNLLARTSIDTLFSFESITNNKDISISINKDLSTVISKGKNNNFIVSQLNNLNQAEYNIINISNLGTNEFFINDS